MEGRKGKGKNKANGLVAFSVGHRPTGGDGQNIAEVRHALSLPCSVGRCPEEPQDRWPCIVSQGGVLR